MPIRKNLEGKLRAIQELKSEKYIGTKEAWNYLDRVNALYENPVKISEEINEELLKEGPVHYKATPERIIGLGEFYNKTFHDLEIESGKPFDDDFSFSEGSPLINYKFLVFGKKTVGMQSFEKRDPEKLAQYLISIFKNIQSPETTNKDYGIYAIDYTLDNINEEKNKKEWILSKVYSADWDYVCSRENLRNIERESRIDIFLDEIEIGSRIARMHRDLVHNKLENKREILTDYINKMASVKKINYDSLRGMAFEIMQRCKDRFERLKQIAHTPKTILKNEQRMIKEYSFLLRLIDDEKNFINKYLKN